MLSVLLRFADSDYPYKMFILFLIQIKFMDPLKSSVPVVLYYYKEPVLFILFYLVCNFILLCHEYYIKIKEAILCLPF